MTEIEKMAEVIATAIVGDTADNEDTQSSIPLATALYKQGYRKQEDTVKEFAEKIMDKNCRNCEHAFLETCKGCNTLPPNNTYENFELRKDITAEKHRADVAEEALKLACQQLGYELHLFGVNKNIVVEPRIIEFKEQAEERLKEKKE